MAGEPRSINDFVDEIMLKILSYIGPEDLCFIIAKVCDRWNGLAKDVTLWKTLSYSCDPTSDISCVEQVLTVAPALRSLIIREREDALRILGILFDNHVNLRQLILKDCTLGQDRTGILTDIMTYSDLEVLSLESCYWFPSARYRLISRLKKLSELNLKDCWGLSGETVRIIADSCQHLKKLSLDRCYPIDDDDVIHVIRKLGKQLTTLVLNLDLTDVAYLYLNNCARLQELKVRISPGMTERGLQEGIGSLRELTSLRLSSGDGLTAQAWSTFLHGPCMTSIVSLDLSECYSLDDEGLKGIAKRCIHLKELAACWCYNVTDAGISMVMSNCNQLCVLNLSGLQYITGNGYLALVPSHLPHLRLLYLWGCDSMCDEYIEELVAAAPELVVINHTGKVVGGMRNLQLEAVCSELELTYVITSDVYDIIRQWALNR